MAWVQYDAYQENLLTQADTAVDHDADTFKIALVTATYTPDRATHDFWDDVSANEVSGTNYTAGGNACANPTVTTSGNTTTWDADDPATWSQDGAGFTDARYAILYKDSGVAGTSNLVAYHDFGTDQDNTSGDFTVQLDADGIATIS